MGIFYGCTDYADFAKGDSSDGNTAPVSNLVSTPVFNPPAGTYNDDQNVEITSTPAGAVICYTDDGTVPTCNTTKDACSTGTKYSGAVAITEGLTTLKALGCKINYDDSSLETSNYDISYPIQQQTSFTQAMKTSVTPTLIAKSKSGSSWVTIPTTTATFSWTDSTTLEWNTGWVKFPENTQLQFTISNLQDAGGISVADKVIEITTTARNNQWPLTDTGQTTCYNDTTSISCGNTSWPRQDGDYTNTPVAHNFIGPTQHATYTNDYTTTDNVTGLVWKSCSEGQSGTTCATGTASQMTWYNAVNGCAALNTSNSGNGYAGRKDWRLPTVSELETLPNYDTFSPVIDTEKFPATPTGKYNWTSTTYIYGGSSSGDSAWYINFNLGWMDSANKATNNLYVRCVAGTSTSNQSFIDNGNGTITDSATNLIWQKCSAGLSGADCASGTIERKTWQNALQYCKNLSLDGRTWRLPSLKELKTLVDRNKKVDELTQIDQAAFPNTQNELYWTSTTRSDSTDNAWYIHFYYGSLFPDNKLGDSHVRCVSSAP